MGKEKLARVIGIALIITSVITIATSTMPKSEGLNVEINPVYVKSYGEELLENHNTKIAEQKEAERLAEIKRLEEEAEAKRIADEQEAKRLADIQKARELARAKANAIAKAKAKEDSIQASRGSGNVTEKTFELTFYTSLPDENGGFIHMANGERVDTATNAIASNYYKLGTQIYLNGYGTYTVKDRGGSSFNNSNRLDVLILRNAGESDSEYKTRVRNMGRKKVTGYVQK